MLLAPDKTIINIPLPGPIPTINHCPFTEGNKYYYGINCERNYTLAIKYYLQAAEEGNLEAMVRLSDCYSKGVHNLKTGRDVCAAREWLCLAAQNVAFNI